MHARLVHPLIALLFAFSVRPASAFELPSDDDVASVQLATRFVVQYFVGDAPNRDMKREVWPAFKSHDLKKLMDKGVSEVSIRSADLQHFKGLRFSCDYPGDYAAFYAEKVTDDGDRGWLRLCSPGTGECLIVYVAGEKLKLGEVVTACLDHIKEKQGAAGYSRADHFMEKDIPKFLSSSKLEPSEYAATSYGKQDAEVRLFYIAVNQPVAAKAVSLAVILSCKPGGQLLMTDDLSKTFDSLETYEPDPVDIERSRKIQEEVDALDLTPER